MGDNVNRLTTRDAVAQRALDNVRDVVNPLLRRTSSLETNVSTLSGSVSGIEGNLSAGTQTGLTWDDIQGPALQAGGTAALTQEPYGDTSWSCLFFKYNQDDKLSFGFQMPHRWNRGVVHCHAHVVPMADPASAEVVKLSGRYTWAQYGVATAAWASWTTFDVAHTVNPGDAHVPTIISLFSDTPTGGKESDFLLVYLMRPGATDAADTYQTNKYPGTIQANLAILNCDTHFQINKSGTVQEYPT